MLIALIIVIVLTIILFRFYITGFSIIEDNLNESIKIGYIGGLSGDTASVGIENLRGVEIAVDKINDNGGINNKKVELIIQDDQYNSKESINAYKTLQSQGVKYIIIETYGGYLALAKLAEKDDILLIDSIDSTNEMSNIGESSFAIGIYDESIGYKIAEYLNKNNVKKVGIFTDYDDPFPVLVKNAFLEKYNGEIKAEDYSLDAKDYREMITKVKEYPYLLLIGWDETGRIVKQARELGYNGQIIGVDTFATENFKKNTQNNYNGLLFTFWEGNSKNNLFLDLVNEYKIKYNSSPDNVLYLSTGYDSTNVLLYSMNNCDYKNTLCVKSNLLNIDDYNGASGKIKIDLDHVSRSIQESMFKYENDQIVELKFH